MRTRPFLLASPVGSGGDLLKELWQGGDCAQREVVLKHMGAVISHPGFVSA